MRIFDENGRHIGDIFDDVHSSYELIIYLAIGIFIGLCIFIGWLKSWFVYGLFCLIMIVVPVYLSLTDLGLDKIKELSVWEIIGRSFKSLFLIALADLVAEIVIGGCFDFGWVALVMGDYIPAN